MELAFVSSPLPCTPVDRLARTSKLPTSRRRPAAACGRLSAAAHADGPSEPSSRRAVLRLLGLAATSVPLRVLSRVTVADPDAGSRVIETASGLRYFDFVTTPDSPGATPATRGSSVTMHYTLGTTGARNGWRIETSVGREPLRFRVGDGAVVRGLDEGVVGMREGGRRRLLIPAALGYHGSKDRPVPVGFAEYQRFKNIYLNPDRPYLPDVVIDVTMVRVQ